MTISDMAISNYIRVDHHNRDESFALAILPFNQI